jgi:uncharacterized glyoxalase superfamily metalloenzyme YdcJ
MSPGRSWEPWKLRAEFARRLSRLYAREVPSYATLLAVTREVNEDLSRGWARGRGSTGTERLAPARPVAAERVAAERHGAVRVGTPGELAQIARIFAAMGMFPVGFYDLREAAASPVPVVSTAFRPVDPDELARSPFRVFTSMLVPADRRFFTADLQRRLETFLAARSLFPPSLLELADRAVAAHGLDADDAETFLTQATRALALSTEPVDRAWYAELARVSAVAADIGGSRGTHLNHLTPRVLDIDELYRRLRERGIAMIDSIQGPPRWDGPDLLLRQTSFRALPERRPFREADGTITEGTVRVRFGEVEARGIAVTPRGRALYDQLVDEVDRAAREAAPATDRSGLATDRLGPAIDRSGPATGHAAPAIATAPRRGAAGSSSERAELATRLWNERVPASESALDAQGLAYFTYAVETDDDGRPRGSGAPPTRLRDLVANGWLRVEPIVYEDFLPRSAAGIFRSNLDVDGSTDGDGHTGGGGGHTDGDGHRDRGRPAAVLDASWLAGILGRTVHDPYALYNGIRQASVTQVAERLGLGRLDLGSTRAL